MTNIWTEHDIMERRVLMERLETQYNFCVNCLTDAISFPGKHSGLVLHKRLSKHSMSTQLGAIGDEYSTMHELFGMLTTGMVGNRFLVINLSRDCPAHIRETLGLYESKPPFGFGSLNPLLGFGERLIFRAGAPEDNLAVLKACRLLFNTDTSACARDKRWIFLNTALVIDGAYKTGVYDE